MKKPPLPTQDLTIEEAKIYLKSVVDYYTFELGEDIRSFDTQQKIYEADHTFA
jgi:hypothetical protein